MTIIDTTIGPRQYTDDGIRNVANRQDDRNWLDASVDAYLKAGGKINHIETGVSSYNIPPPPQLSDKNIEWAHLQHTGLHGRSINSIAKELGVTDVELRGRLNKYRERQSAMKGARASNRGNAI